jgi:hypothetical protein
MFTRLVGLAIAVVTLALVCFWAGSFTGQQWTLWRFLGITACLAVFAFGAVLALLGGSRRQSPP